MPHFRKATLCGGLLIATVLMFLFVIPSVSQTTESPSTADDDPPGTGGWLTGTTEEKFAQIERHLRGLDVSMAEIGYRYGELLFAAKLENWEYAKYQTEKIDLSLRLALERRPARAESSMPFLEESLPPVMAAIAAQDGDQLTKALEQLHAGCVECHRKENVLHFKDAVDRIKVK